LGVTENLVGLRGSPTIVSDMTIIESKRECEMIEGSLEEKADFLIDKLIEAGVI
jgi:electron transfer flavoprotein beta subunit